MRVERLPPGPEKRFPDLQCVLDALGKMQITSLLVEGGASVNWAFLKAGAVDKIWLFYAPKILGGGTSVGFAGGEGFGAMAEAAPGPRPFPAPLRGGFRRRRLSPRSVRVASHVTLFFGDQF